MRTPEDPAWEPVASMNHVLRDPLSVMTGYLELLLMEAHGPLRPEQIRTLEAVRENLRRLGRALEEILEYAALREGGVSVASRRVEVGALMEEAANELREELADRRWELELRPPGEPVEVLGDPRVILRLVRGMARVPDGAGPGRMDIAWRRAGRDGEIRVGGDPGEAGVEWDRPLGSCPGGPSPALARLLAASMGGTLEEGPGPGVLVLTLRGAG